MFCILLLKVVSIDRVYYESQYEVISLAYKIPLSCTPVS